MAFFSGVIRSSVLAMDTGLSVILPYDRPAEPQQEPCKTLYLLHGLGDNAAAWPRYTAIETYAREKGLAVVMPEVQRSFYCDMAYGPRYFTYITEELPELCARMFHLSREREASYIAGLSMGGYGALKCGFRRPDLYSGCASFSGVVDIVKAMEDHNSSPQLQEEFRAIIGMDLQIPDRENLLLLAQKVAALPEADKPSIFLTCGAGDFLHSINIGFKEHLEALPLPFTYREWPGEHTWAFWNESVRRLLDYWFPCVD